LRPSEKKIKNHLGRAGTLTTPHGVIETPAFVTVGTKATVKALSPEQVRQVGAQIVLANTYHLYLEPGDEILKRSGSLHKFMNWPGPTMTDSGGFQVFSLGVAYGKRQSKINNKIPVASPDEATPSLAKIDDEGVTFKSPRDGSLHRFTPETSIAAQHNIGADMIFAFDECTSPTATYEYQKKAAERTHRWAKRSLDYHHGRSQSKLASLIKMAAGISAPASRQALFGIVQGGRFEDLRKKSATVISSLDFDGFGIGGSFEKIDMYDTVGWVNAILPEEKIRHLLGIGEPADLFGGIENGVDLFDCVNPTRLARNGTLYTKAGKINIEDARFTRDFSPIEKDCQCYSCQNYTKAYISHLFRAKEMFGKTLASIHNLFFIINLVKNIRQSILDKKFSEYKENFLSHYQT